MRTAGHLRDCTATRRARRRACAFALAAVLIPLHAVAAPAATVTPSYQTIPATSFTSIIDTGDISKPEQVQVPAFELRSEPVTNAQFLAFVQANPDWQRGQAPAVFADAGYLSHWQSSSELGADALPTQPVTRVSWFAAQAYCESEGGRLPSWIEWERAAAASTTVADARKDPAWRQQLLDWYAKPSRGALASVGGAPNLYGVRDLHGLVWEWVDDYAALMVSADSRDQNDPDRLKFCGAAALSMRDRDNYALLMRIAMLSSLKAASTTTSLGFRCARGLKEAKP